jgi:hypothetical protein
MIITISKIPNEYHNSILYEELGKDFETDSLKLPDNVPYMQELTITSENDLKNFMNVYEFWGFRIIPQKLFTLFINNKNSLWFENFLNDSAIIERFKRTDIYNTLWIIYNEGCLLTYFAKEGNIQYLRFMHEIYFGKGQSCIKNNDAYKNYCAVSAKHGHILCLQFLCEHNYPCDNSMIHFAIEGGNIDCLKYLYEKKYSSLSYLSGYGFNRQCSFLYTAVINDQVDCLNFILKNDKCLYEVDLFGYYCGCNPEDYLYCICKDNLFYTAMKVGSSKCLEYLYTNIFQSIDINDSSTRRTFNITLGRGHLHCIKFLVNKGYLLNEESFEIAVKSSHLDCVKYLHERNCPYYNNLCYLAASYGRYSCLEFLVSKGYYLDEQACNIAELNENPKCFEYCNSVLGLYRDYKKSDSIYYSYCIEN